MTRRRSTNGDTPMPVGVAPPCTGRTKTFYSTNTHDLEDAKFICRGCPYQAPCLEVALSRREDKGVWGGHDMRPGHFNDPTTNKVTRRKCPKGHSITGYNAVYPDDGGIPRCGTCGLSPLSTRRTTERKD